MKIQTDKRYRTRHGLIASIETRHIQCDRYGIYHTYFTGEVTNDERDFLANHTWTSEGISTSNRQFDLFREDSLKDLAPRMLMSLHSADVDDEEVQKLRSAFNEAIKSSGPFKTPEFGIMPAEPHSCCFVDVGFMHSKMVCKICDKEQT